MSETAGVQAKNLLFDEAEARRRVENRTADFYGVKFVEDLLLSQADFALAETAYWQEAEIVYDGTNTLTTDGLFRGISYSLLTPLQNYTGQDRGFKAMFDENMQPINANLKSGMLASVLQAAGIIFYSQKAENIWQARNKLVELNLIPTIQENIATTREREVALRQVIASEFRGLGLKNTSILLRMCGSQFLIPIDSWMVEMLYFHGYPCQMPRTKVERERWETKDRTYNKDRKTGLSNKLYFTAEDCALDLAQKYGVPGHILQLAFWAKNSAYGTQPNRQEQPF